MFITLISQTNSIFTLPLFILSRGGSHDCSRGVIPRPTTFIHNFPSKNIVSVCNKYYFLHYDTVGLTKYSHALHVNMQVYNSISYPCIIAFQNVTSIAYFYTWMLHTHTDTHIYLYSKSSCKTIIYYSCLDSLMEFYRKMCLQYMRWKVYQQPTHVNIIFTRHISKNGMQIYNRKNLKALQPHTHYTHKNDMCFICKTTFILYNSEVISAPCIMI